MQLSFAEKKTGIKRKRPLFVALPTEKVKDVDKNSCWNNQATEHGNNSDKNTRGSLFFYLNRFGRIVTFCIKWNIIAYAFGLCFYQEVFVFHIVQPYHQTADDPVDTLCLFHKKSISGLITDC